MQMYAQEVEDLKAECSRGDFLAKVFNNLLAFSRAVNV